MTTQFNFEKYKNELFYGVVNTKFSLEHNEVKEENIASETERLNFLENLEKSLFPIIRLSSSEIYEHTDNFNDTSGTNQFFKNLFNIEENDYAKIVEALDIYFNQEKYRSPELDWMYIDAYIYSLYSFTKYSGGMAMIKKYDPLSYKILIRDSDFLQVQAILVFIWKIIKWLLWIGLIFFCFAAGSDNRDGEIFTWIGAALLIYKTYSTIRRIRNSKKDDSSLNEKLKLIEKAYSNLSTINYNKQLLMNDLLQCRNNGIDIPNSIFSYIK